MDVLAESALSTLESVMTGLLPSTIPQGLGRPVRIVPSSVRPSGIGGYVGTHPDPRGSLFARRVLATFEVEVTGGNDTAASTHLGQVVRTLLTQERGDLLRVGVRRLTLHADGLETRRATFDVDYEYRHIPTAGEGIIDLLDLSVDLNSTPYRMRFRFDVSTRSLVGAADPLAEFFAVDDPDLNASSPAGNWVFNSGQSRIEQTTLARGGPLTLSQARKAGPQLLWRPNGLPEPVARFIAVADFETAQPDGIGLVFGRRDDQHCWYFLASESNGYHIFGRKDGTTYSVIGTPAAAGVELGVRHVLTVIAYDQTLIAEIDGVRTLDVTAPAPIDSGEVGFLTHGNNQARFFRARLIELE